jgi:hypothetical protein
LEKVEVNFDLKALKIYTKAKACLLVPNPMIYGSAQQNLEFLGYYRPSSLNSIAVSGNMFCDPFL